MAILIPRVMEEPTWATCVINLRPGVTTSFLTSRSDHRHSRHCHHTISGIRHIVACHHYRFLYSSKFLWSAVRDIFQTRLLNAKLCPHLSSYCMGGMKKGRENMWISLQGKYLVWNEGKVSEEENRKQCCGEGEDEIYVLRKKRRVVEKKLDYRKGKKLLWEWEREIKRRNQQNSGNGGS